MLEDIDDLLGDGLTGGERAEDGSKPVSGETERGHRAGGAWGQGGRLQESCQSDHHSVVTHTENPALFMVEVTGVLRNHTLNPRRTLDDLRPGAESPASPCTVLIRHCIIPRQSSPYIRQVPFLPTSCKRAAVIFEWH